MREIIIYFVAFLIIIIPPSLTYNSFTTKQFIKEIPSVTETDRLIQEGITLYKIGLYESSLEKLNQAIKNQPYYSLTHFYAGETLKELGKLKQAKNEYSKTIKLEPESWRARYQLADIIKDTHIEQSIDLLSEVIEINPYYRKAYVLLGKIYRDNDMDKKAEKLIKEYRKKQEGNK